MTQGLNLLSRTGRYILYHSATKESPKGFFNYIIRNKEVEIVISCRI